MKLGSKILVIKALVLIFVFAKPAIADLYQDAYTAYSKTDYMTAAQLWSSKELENDPRALFSLGRLNMKGLGVEQNEELAVDFYTRAADLGHLSAQFNLGLAYFKGTGVPKDIKKVVSLWTIAANAGHDAAQYNMGALMWEGTRVEKDQAVAMKWFRESMNNGNGQAKEFLRSLFEPMYSELEDKARFYEEKNPDRELSLIEELGLYKLGKQAYENDDFEQAYKYWITLAKDGHGDSQFMIATMYERGEAVLVNLENALKWYQEAAKFNHAEAQYRLGMYHFKEAPDVNETLGLYWMQSSADNGHTKAQAFLDSGS